MNSEVMKSIDIKFDVFEQYFDLPADVADEVVAFRTKVEEMAEDCVDAVNFEEKFASMGFQDEYNAFFARCKAKPAKMTAEQKKESRKIFNEIAFGSNDKKVIAGKIAAAAAKDIAEHAATDIESESIRMRRERMIEEGTYDDYTRASNKIHSATRAAGLIKGLFGKK